MTLEPKEDGVLSYEDPSAAHAAAGGFYNSKFRKKYLDFDLCAHIRLVLTHAFSCLSDYKLRGKNFSVTQWKQNLHHDLHLLLDKAVVVVVDVVDLETTTEMEVLGLIDINMEETVHALTDGICTLISSCIKICQE